MSELSSLKELETFIKKSGDIANYMDDNAIRIRNLYRKLQKQYATVKPGNSVFCKTIICLRKLCNIANEVHVNLELAIKLYNKENRVKIRRHTCCHEDTIKEFITNFANQYYQYIAFVIEDAIYQIENKKQRMYVVIFVANKYEIMNFGFHINEKIKLFPEETPFNVLLTLFKEHYQGFGGVVRYYTFDHFLDAVMNENRTKKGGGCETQNRYIIKFDMPSTPNNFTINKEFKEAPHKFTNENFDHFFGYMANCAGNKLCDVKTFTLMKLELEKLKYISRYTIIKVIADSSHKMTHRIEMHLKYDEKSKKYKITRTI